MSQHPPLSLLPLGADQLFSARPDVMMISSDLAQRQHLLPEQYPWKLNTVTWVSHIFPVDVICRCRMELNQAAFWNGTSRKQQTDCGRAFPEKEKPPIDQQELWSHKCKQGFQRKWDESLEDGHGKFPYRKIQTHCIPVKRTFFFFKSKYVHKYWLIWFS